jgi:hypothetical protein
MYIQIPKVSAYRKAVTITGHLTRDFYTFLGSLPGYKKFTATGAVFAATRPHIDAFRGAFPSIDIDDRDGTIANIYKPIPEIIDHGRKTTAPVPLFAHQKHAINIGLSREYFAFWHEMGTGKSAILLNLIAELGARQIIDRVIIFAPKRVVPQILDEQIKLHMPRDINFRAAAFPSTQATKAFRYPDNNLLIAVAGYGALQSTKQTNDLIEFAKGGKCAVIADESHNLKGWTTKRRENLWRLRPHTTRRYLFSGSPAPLGPIDLFAPFMFLDDNILGHTSLTSFKNNFCLMGGFEGRSIVGYRNLPELTKATDPHCEYIHIADIQDMPEQIYTTLKLAPSKQQIEIYNRLKDDFVIAIEQATNAGDTEIKSKLAKNAAAKFIAMQQVSSGFFYADKEREEDKRGELIILNDDRANYIAEDLIQGEKTVVFTRFHASMDALKRAFDANGIKAVELSGRRSAQENDAAKDAFLNDDETLVLYATAASAGTGLNLQKSSKIIFMENSFSYGDRVQSEARFWRVGQKNHCRYYDIVQFPIDKLVLANLQKKQDLSQQLQSLAAMKQFAGEL